MSDAPRAFRFTRASRLQHKREFDAVYSGKARVERGPLVIHAVPAATGRSRLGLAIGRRLGNAVRRTRMKRLMRECFRLGWAEFPGEYDVIIGCRPHEELPLETYRACLREAMTAIHLLWTKRQRRTASTSPATPAASPPADPTDGPASSPAG